MINRWIALCFFLNAFTGFANPSSAEIGQLIVAAILPLSGSQAPYGHEARIAMELAQQGLATARAHTGRTRLVEAVVVGGLPGTKAQHQAIIGRNALRPLPIEAPHLEAAAALGLRGIRSGHYINPA